MVFKRLRFTKVEGKYGAKFDQQEVSYSPHEVSSPKEDDIFSWLIINFPLDQKGSSSQNSRYKTFDFMVLISKVSQLSKSDQPAKKKMNDKLLKYFCIFYIFIEIKHYSLNLLSMYHFSKNIWESWRSLSVAKLN